MEYTLTAAGEVELDCCVFVRWAVGIYPSAVYGVELISDLQGRGGGGFPSLYLYELRTQLVWVSHSHSPVLT